MEKILAQAGQLGVEAEVFRGSSRETSIEFENNSLKRVETVERAGLAVRVIARGRLGFATSSLPADEESVLRQAIDTAAFGKEIRFALPGHSPEQRVEVYDPSVPKIAPEEMVAYGEELINPLRLADPKFKAGVSLAAAETRGELANTAGFAMKISKTFFGGSVSGTLIEGESFLELGEGFFSCRRTDDLMPLRDRVLNLLEQGRNNVALGSGRYPILFTPTAHASLLGPVLSCLNGKAVEKGSSPFRDRLGDQVFALDYTLYDDPLRPFAPSTTPFDAEGLPSAKTVLIEGGVLRTFLVDLDTASALNIKPNGNARRGGWSAPPGPGSSTLVALPGKKTSEELLSGIEEGLLVHYLMGAGQSNPYGGVINANIMLGFLVRAGKVIGRVKNTMLAANVFELLQSRLLGLSSDSETVSGTIVLPYLLADGVAVTAGGN